ncbi:MAG TPA: hypothetical protein VF254_01475 [Gammaproteobacteria bacterium]
MNDRDRELIPIGEMLVAIPVGAIGMAAVVAMFALRKELDVAYAICVAGGAIQGASIATGTVLRRYGRRSLGTGIVLTGSALLVLSLALSATMRMNVF